MISLIDALPVFMDLQLGGDRALRKLSYSHVVQDIRRLNIKNKNDPVNKPLQNILFNSLQVYQSVQLEWRIGIGNLIDVGFSCVKLYNIMEIAQNDGF